MHMGGALKHTSYMDSPWEEYAAVPFLAGVLWFLAHPLPLFRTGSGMIRSWEGILELTRSHAVAQLPWSCSHSASTAPAQDEV